MFLQAENGTKNMEKLENTYDIRYLHGPQNTEYLAEGKADAIYAGTKFATTMYGLSTYSWEL